MQSMSWEVGSSSEMAIIGISEKLVNAFIHSDSAKPLRLASASSVSTATMAPWASCSTAMPASAVTTQRTS